MPELNQEFCAKCGAKTIEACDACKKEIRGKGFIPGAVEWSEIDRPSYCQHCGKPFPWTGTALIAAKEYADELESLSEDEKSTLTQSLGDLTSDTPRTALAVSRVRKFMEKIGGPAAQGFMQIVVSDLTEEAQRQLGMK